MAIKTMSGQASWKIAAFIAGCALVMAGKAHAGPSPLILTTAAPGQAPAVESEHRPLAERTYWLGGDAVSGSAKAYLMRADGATEEIAVEKGKSPQSVSVKLPMKEGPGHGANNLYVVDRKVSGSTLIERTAKRTIIQHNCGWGHEHKYDKDRMTSRFLAEAPLEIVCGGMWDGNFHVNTQSGDELSCKVLSYGKPAGGARVEVATEKGWIKKLMADDQGAFKIELIRDYYPETWTKFDRGQMGQLMVAAEYDSAESGIYEGAEYGRKIMVSTFPWRYSPSRRDFTSYSHGLAIGGAFIVIPSIIVYFYRERRKRPFKEVVFDE